MSGKKKSSQGVITVTPYEGQVHVEAFSGEIVSDASAMSMIDAITYLKNSINNLNNTIVEVDKMNKLRFTTLKVDMENISGKLNTKASQKSLDEIAANLKGDLQSIKTTVDAVMNHLQHRPR